MAVHLLLGGGARTHDGQRQGNEEGWARSAHRAISHVIGTWSAGF
jgi:hypothetical protein